MHEFNIYYLNFSKVYEITIQRNIMIPEEIIAEKQLESQSMKSISLKHGNADGNATLGYQKKTGEYSKLTEKLKVKEEKSLLLNKIIPLCESVVKIDRIDEGKLIKIENVKIDFYDDEEMQRTYSLMKKEILESITTEGMDINKFILPIMTDMSFLMKCKLNKSEVAFKIPMESKSEFENKYTINDLLIGNLTIIGVYKGKILEKDFKRSTLYSVDSNNNYEIDLVESSGKEDKKVEYCNNDCIDYIDIFAIIQPIKHDKTNITENQHDRFSLIRKWIGKIKHFLKG
ncbi:hypothetical protein [uncultured Methanobrevibacter sp.]|uniref:hypothetical protein n=1 Tax=uncultured Methanobrevibacter sp. TaxID=253161 RepID=UPI0026DF484F|nr:hypothetical protein [uncultured Methanobrevibacter sp.]